MISVMDKKNSQDKRVEYRLASRVPRQLKEDVEILVARFGRMRFRKRVLGIEGVLCSAVVAFLDLDPKRQGEILARNLRRVEEAFDAEDN